jgi:uncharacterized repeat protein (TIGR03803 family)
MGKFNWWMTACSLFLLCAAAVALPAQAPTAPAPTVTFTTLHSFEGTDGSAPEAGLVQATDGNLYGTTSYGGSDGICSRGLGCGTVFAITPSGTLTTLHSFDRRDGDTPSAGLVQATNGNLYGTAAYGGANGSCPRSGCGTVFKITTTGTLTTLRSFDGTDGEDPLAGLVQASNGNLYGTTFAGGAGNAGTVFAITPSDTLTTLHSFEGTDGEFPDAGLVQATNGKFYGTVYLGGATFDGTVFKITPSGTLTTLHGFDGGDGTGPDAALVQAAGGDFYGITRYGGAGNDGTVFKITPSGTLTMLHSFDGTDGALPEGLVQATNGDFYGTTIEGGTNNGGTVFTITPSGTLTTLYNFCSQGNCTDGSQPEAGLIQDTNGTFYGTTYGGGANDDGTVFSLSVGLGPFVETEPTSRRVGGTVKILGTSLTGTTSVTFNGTAATFTVVSASEITTTVPTSATTGTVQVVTPGGTLSSNVPFRVTP